MLRFILKSLVLALLIIACMLAGRSLGWFALPSFFTEIIIFFSLSTSAVYWFITRKLGAQPEDFVKIFLGVTVLRILFFAGFIGAVIMFDKMGAWENALFFLACYFLFTAMEVLILFRQINSQKPRNGGQKKS